MTRSQLNPMPEYFDRYINLCDDVTIDQAIKTSLDELKQLPVTLWEAIGDQVYAPGKWTIKDILQHLIDTERIFGYRAVAIARGEQQTLPSFDEDSYARAATTGHRTLTDLIDELYVSHQSFYALYKSFTPEMLQVIGQGAKGPYSVASIGFCMPGHQRWHFAVIRERYMHLANK